MAKQTIILLTLLIFFGTCFNVSLAQQVPKVDYLSVAKYYESKNNLNAAVYFYKEHINAYREETDNNLLFHYAKLALQTFKYLDAELYFEQLSLSNFKDEQSEVFFWLAMAKKSQGKYQEALTAIKRYKESNPQESILKKRSDIEEQFLSSIYQLINNPLEVDIERAPSQINSVFSEYNAIEDDQVGIYFNTIRPLSENVDNNLLDDYFVTQIFLAPYNSKGLGEAKSFSKVINNPKYHINSFCFNENKDKIYLARTPISEKSKKASIWYSNRNEQQQWEKAKPLDNVINEEGFTSFHPYLVCSDQYDVLYFSSDKPGGYGGMDIWYSILEDGKFHPAVNLGGNINTQGDEVSPYYDIRTQKLYFSSNFHGGFGGFDIFYNQGALGAWSETQNIGYPINSGTDELFFNINDFNTNGFFASNRSDSTANEENCCFDIYCFEQKKQNLVETKDTVFAINEDVYQQSINTLLPITLYFHNDEPNPRSRDITTNKDYEQTLKEYTTLKHIYKKEYGKGLKDDDKQKAEQEIETFFNQKVEGSLALLKKIDQYLINDLSAGKEITLTISGFASPLFSDDYNTNLSLRRIISYENYLRKQPALAPYFDPQRQGNQIKIVAIPKGKSMSNRFVSDNPNDKRNSVYSISAALERRIQLSSYESKYVNKEQEKPIVVNVPPREITVEIEKETDIITLYLEIQNLDSVPYFITELNCDCGCVQLPSEKKIELKKNSRLFLPITIGQRCIKKTASFKISVVINNILCEFKVNARIKS